MQFRHYWASGETNLVDYVTKHYPAIHHQATRGTYLTDITKLIELQNPQKVTEKTITSRSKGRVCWTDHDYMSLQETTRRHWESESFPMQVFHMVTEAPVR